MTTDSQSVEAAVAQPLTLEEKVRAFTALSSLLTDLIEQENSVLSSKRPAAIRELLEEKEKLSARFSIEIAAIRADKAGLSTLDAGLRNTLKSELDRFQKAVDSNGRVLRKLKQIGDGMIGAIVDHMNPGARRATYANPNARPTGRAAPATIALNAVI